MSRSTRATRTDQAVLAHAGLQARTRDLEIHADGPMEGAGEFAEMLQCSMQAFLALTASLPGFTRPAGRIAIYLSDRITVSHVIGGYRHPLDPRPILFLNQRSYHGFLRGANATVLHELTHLHFWQYRSHSLREGFADFVALSLRPGACIGPNGSSLAPVPDLARSIRSLVGTAKPPPALLRSDMAYRQHYYFMSRLFVRHAISSVGAREFMSLYGAADPASLYRPMFGCTRHELFDAAVQPAFGSLLS